jgi:polygalacturonase
MENYLNCDDLILQGVNVENQCNWNNDGFDIDGCHNVIVRDCLINAEDDAMCFKGAGLRPTENVLIENCQAYTECSALKFGTDSEANFRNILVRNVELGGVPENLPAFARHASVSGISWEAVDGGTVENIVVYHAHITRARVPIFLRLGNRGRTMPGQPKPPVGKLQDIVFEDITGGGEQGSIIAGIPAHPIQQVIFRNVKLSVAGGGTLKQATANLPEEEAGYPEAKMFGPVVPAYGFWLRHAGEISFENVQVTPLKPDACPQIGAGDDTTGILVDGKPLPQNPASAAN